MKKYLLPISAILLAAGTAMAADDQAPAFPGAEGHGRYTTGGRGGVVRHVTNLNDSGEGSLRAAVSGSAKKIVVFDVSGYIDLKEDLKVGANTTIAGQTAPGDGITLRYYTLRPNGNNIIIRFIRSRRSQVKDINDGADAAFCRYFTNIIIDHCSFSWSIDELASFYDNRNFTLQWTSLGEGLNDPGHSKGAHSYGGIWGGKEASFHHNFMSHVQNRAPRFCGARYQWDGYDKTRFENSVDAERVDYRNCVVYNWGTGGCYGGPGGGYINMVNNYYKAGPGTSNKTRLTTVTVGANGNSTPAELHGLCSRYYISGNYMAAAANPENYDWTSDGTKYDGGLFTFYGDKYMKDANHKFGENVEYYVVNDVPYLKVKMDTPTDPGTVTTHAATTVYDKVLRYCGASLARDAVDTRYFEEARTGTTTYTGEKSGRAGIVDFVNDPDADPLPNRPDYPALASETRPAGFDTDGDGIPDAWETAHGLNPNDAADGKASTLDSRGWYTNVEVYLNSIVEHIVKGGNADAETAVDEYYPALDNSAIADIIAPEGQVDRIEYYDLRGNRLSEPADGISIRRTVYTDGSVYTDKVIK